MRNLSMKKFGTPIGAGPGTAIDVVGSASVGSPSLAAGAVARVAVAVLLALLLAQPRQPGALALLVGGAGRLLAAGALAGRGLRRRGDAARSAAGGGSASIVFGRAGAAAAWCS